MKCGVGVTNMQYWVTDLLSRFGNLATEFSGMTTPAEFFKISVVIVVCIWLFVRVASSQAAA